MKLIQHKAQGAADVVAHDATPLEVNTDARAFSRIGWLIVLFGVGGFLLWAMLSLIHI